MAQTRDEQMASGGLRGNVRCNLVGMFIPVNEALRKYQSTVVVQHDPCKECGHCATLSREDI